MKKFIIKENHNINDLIKIHADYTSKISILNDDTFIKRILLQGSGERLADLLKENNINTFNDVSLRSEYSLLRIKGFGGNSLYIINRLLEEVGLCLSPENEQEILEQEELKKIRSQKAKMYQERAKKRKEEERLAVLAARQEAKRQFEEQCRIQSEKNKKLAAEIRAENERIEAERKANPIMFIQR